jgi:hypothetical protein
MPRSRAVAALFPLVLAAALVSGCGRSDEASDAGASTSASSSGPGSSAPATTPTATSSAPATDGDDSAEAPPFPANTEPDTGEASAGSAVTVTDVRTGRHDGFDRVVFEVAGTGAPGWDVRYVDEAVEQGRGQRITVAGRAILQVAITGVGYPTETGIEEYDGSDPLPGAGTEVVTEVVWDSTFEGTSVAFVGTTDETPFRVYLLDNPSRVVLDVVHPS